LPLKKRNKGKQQLQINKNKTMSKLFSLSGFFDYFPENEAPENTLDGAGDAVFQIITDKILEILESGEELSWRKTWGNKDTGMFFTPMNYVSQKPYKGINKFILSLAGKQSHFWLTFNQIKELNGTLKKGSKAQPVLAYFPNYSDPITGEKLSQEEGKKREEKDPDSVKKWFSVRYYNVHSADDVTGINFKYPELPSENIRIERAEQIVANMPNPPIIKNIAGNKDAVYKPKIDTVEVPTIEDFDSESEYYATLFHELVHSTGHTKRLDRFEQYKGKKQDVTYIYEELIAELGASFLCADVGVLFHTIKNSAAYLAGYRKQLIAQMKADNQFIFKAAKLAQKAVEYIHPNYGEEWQNQDTKPKPQPKPQNDPKAKAKAKAKALKLKLSLKNKV
jgi:antirestriction protein ArdC